MWFFFATLLKDEFIFMFPASESNAHDGAYNFLGEKTNSLWNCSVPAHVSSVVMKPSTSKRPGLQLGVHMLRVGLLTTSRK